MVFKAPSLAGRAREQRDNLEDATYSRVGSHSSERGTAIGPSPVVSTQKQGRIEDCRMHTLHRGLVARETYA
jgi:hypothetical protein